MARSTVSCTKCRAPLLLSDSGEAAAVRCAQCQAVSQVYCFPALYEGLSSGLPAQDASFTDTASCFYHAHKTAVVPCDHCGRFLCDLCTIDLPEQRLCPGCLEISQKKHTLERFENHRTLYDNIALALALYPALLLWPTLVTAPLTMFFAAWHWRSPTSIVPRTRVRLVLAIGIAVLQIGGWIAYMML